MLISNYHEKRFTKLASSSHIKKRVEEIFQGFLPQAQRTKILDMLHEAMDGVQGVTSTKKTKNQIIEQLRARIRDDGTYKFSEQILNDLISNYVDNTLLISIREISRDSEEYKKFTKTLHSQNTRPSFKHTTKAIAEAVPEAPIYGIFAEEIFEGKHSTELVLILIAVSAGILWIPATPEEIILESGIKIDKLDFSRLIYPIYNTIIENRQDRGLCSIIIGDNTYPCGEFYSNTPRNRMQEKSLTLANNYTMKLFVEP